MEEERLNELRAKKIQEEYKSHFSRLMSKHVNKRNVCESGDKTLVFKSTYSTRRIFLMIIRKMNWSIA